ncbi:hypothetical protein CRI94_10740 [Longibacter salinarum]|uniref:BIG2 domain-containing protein n=1 Tax=Longibacter salinarum TaxID=1850348 RepID=A0A2A8CXL4_9BACT|nr:Ig-like domain-containing protein [Longibacter salinarum]PEN13118.1 hypothetical protein CRI94_10740 [Longibacter salinarum]
MFADERFRSRSTRIVVSIPVLVLLLATTLLFIGCDSTDYRAEPDEDDIATVIISPDSARIGVGDRLDFSAAALTESGDTVANISLNWMTTDADVFTVDSTGLATGESPGAAFCTVTTQRFVGRDSAFVSVF